MHILETYNILTYIDLKFLYTDDFGTLYKKSELIEKNKNIFSQNEAYGQLTIQHLNLLPNM